MGVGGQSIAGQKGAFYELPGSLDFTKQLKAAMEEYWQRRDGREVGF